MLDAAAWFASLSPVAIQAAGVVGFGLFGLSFQLLKPKNTILLQSFAAIFVATHFLGLGHVCIAFVAFLAGGRDLGSALLPRRAQVMLLGVYLVPLYIGAYFLVENWPDALAVMGSTIATGVQFFRERFYAYRFLSLLHQSFWLSIYVVVFTVPGMIFMSCIWISNVIGIGRFFYRKPSDSKLF
jgi:hypothetical protein